MMAEKINSVCAICGKGYHLCHNCHKKLEPWKNHTDTSEHYKIYQILHGYSTGVYTKSEAKSKLQTVDLSDLESFREHIKALIKTILADDKPVVEAHIVANTEVTKNVSVDVKSEKTNSVDVSTYKPKTVYKKRNSKNGKNGGNR